MAAAIRRADQTTEVLQPKIDERPKLTEFASTSQNEPRNKEVARGMTFPPLIFEPFLRRQIWGGRQLEQLDKHLPDSREYGESWELSAHPLHVSHVNHAGTGLSLQTLVKSHARDFFGTGFKNDRFPLLVKYLDCQRSLSVQVHPSDDLAAQIVGNESGKTEAWVVLKTAPTAKIYAGLKAGATKSDLIDALGNGTVANCLHSFQPRAGDCVYIPAGTIHAMGGGILIAEIQQTSDATFRLFDWNNVDAHGMPRTLHVSESLQCIDWSAGPISPIVPNAISGLPADVSGEDLVDCPFFRLKRMRLAAPWTQEIATWWIGMVIDGDVELRTVASAPTIVRRGQTVLIPASAKTCEWIPKGSASLLLATA